jgi:tetratricopeptide (TPR) repeat protein
MSSAETFVPALADAVARARLSLADIAGISETELEVLFELGAVRLDAGLAEEAATIFAGLTTIFPFQVKYWRAHGIALQRGRRYVEAVRAYDVALLLAADDALTRCYRGECHLYLGHKEAAGKDLAAAAAAVEKPEARERAQRLLLALSALASWQPPAEPARLPTPAAPAEAPRQEGFTLADARPLPLPATPLAECDEALATGRILSHDEVTRTARVFVALAPSPVEATAIEAIPQEQEPAPPEGTQTAVVSRRRAPPQASGTQTAVVPRRRDPPRASSSPGSDPASGDGTHTALVPRPPLGLATAPEQRHAAPDAVTSDAPPDERTAIVRRRRGALLKNERR